MGNPLTFTDESGWTFRVLAGRRYHPTGSYRWVPPATFYGTSVA